LDFLMLPLTPKATNVGVHVLLVRLQLLLNTPVLQLLLNLQLLLVFDPYMAPCPFKGRFMHHHPLFS
jgi:hypothetical protein